MNKDLEFLINNQNTKIKLMVNSLIVGIATSIVIILYRLALNYAEKGCFYISKHIKGNIKLIILWFIILALIGYIISKLIEKEPYSGGSGIPQIKAVLGGYIKNRPISTILFKFIGSVLSTLGGLSLGREGPSIQLGGCTGDFVSKKLNSTRLERRYLISSGASAGLSASFNTPLAAVMLSLEEIYKYLSPLILLTTTIAAVSADYISKEVFGLDPIFNFNNCDPIPLRNYWILILLGILCGLLGVLYNKSSDIAPKLFDKIKLPTSFKMVLMFLLSGVIALIFPVILCGGHRVMEELTLSSSLTLLTIVLISKFIYSLISFGSGAPGGTLFPMLIIGCCLGAVFGFISINYLGIDKEYFNNFIILSMAGFFTAIVRAPITGIILVTEMTSSLSHLLSLSLVSIIAYIIADTMKSEPYYESLLSKFIKKYNLKEYHSTSSKKVIITNIVHHGSLIDNKYIKNLTLPENTLIVSIARENKQIVPRGNTLIHPGDVIQVMTDLKDEWKVRELVEAMTSS